MNIHVRYVLLKFCDAIVDLFMDCLGYIPICYKEIG